MTLACEDANSVLLDAIAVAVADVDDDDEDHIGSYWQQFVADLEAEVWS